MVINASRKIWELACGDMYRNARAKCALVLGGVIPNKVYLKMTWSELYFWAKKISMLFYTCLVMSSTKNSTGALMSPFFQEIMENVTKTARSVAASIWALKKCTESLYQCFVCNSFMTGFDKSSGLFLEATTRASECCSPEKLPEQQGLEEATGIQGCKDILAVNKWNIFIFSFVQYNIFIFLFRCISILVKFTLVFV